MPLIQPSNYKVKGLFKNTHFNTIYAAYLKKHPNPNYERERLFTPDEDFFDVDWIKQNNENCVLLLHGLMGSSSSSYVRNSADFFSRKGYDVCAINYRNSSGEANKQPYAYHAGFTDDLGQLVTYIKNKSVYKKLIIVGYSLGGSILLNYLCRNKNAEITFISSAVAISSPLYLLEGAKLLNKLSNKIYMKHFKDQIIESVSEKKEQLEAVGINTHELSRANNFFEIDSLYTAKVFGFKDAHDYFDKASVLQHLKQLKTPTLLLNAKDDMMLGEKSYPYELASSHPCLYFEATDYGGHLGFNQTGEQYYNVSSLNFINKIRDMRSET